MAATANKTQAFRGISRLLRGAPPEAADFDSNSKPALKIRS
jgi:hypothetical protein